jgi:hypothetical protein
MRGQALVHALQRSCYAVAAVGIPFVGDADASDLSTDGCCNVCRLTSVMSWALR